MMHMVWIEETTIDTTEDKPLLMPQLTHLYTRLLLPLPMFFQRLQHNASKHDLAPTCLCFRLTLNIAHSWHPRYTSRTRNTPASKSRSAQRRATISPHLIPVVTQLPQLIGRTGRAETGHPSFE